MSIDFLFKTYFLIIWGLLFGGIYLVMLISTERKDSVNILDFCAVGLSAISIIGGFKLIYLSWLTAYEMDNALEIDKVYTAYGGLCIIWISFRGIHTKIKR